MTVRFVRRPGAALEFLRWQALVQQPDGAWLLAASASSPGKLLAQLAPVMLARCEESEPMPASGSEEPTARRESAERKPESAGMAFLEEDE